MTAQPPPPQGPGPQFPQHPQTPGGSAPRGDLGADLGAALTFMGTGVVRNWRSLVLPAVIYGAIALALDILSALAGDDDSTGLLGLQGVADVVPDWIPIALAPAQLLLAVAYLVIQLLWTAGTLRFGVDVLRGDRQEPTRYFAGDGRVILTIVICGVLTAVGFVLCVIPGLVAMVLLLFAPAATARGTEVAIGDGSRAASRRLGTAVIACVLVLIASSLGTWLNVLDIVITPFTSLFLLGLFERIEGRALPR
ncbi:hypothetical protein [Brachybacterium kimchii]|uniref:Integral membrane protein n=1 Tax=Brachybacterium kimchii TaxID=2942909 RepID=A0ABY4N4Z7_9MICO|nr:hypothetical protein [Brachybacterium kimchii]UQN29631.1 hypothetical protein M4486_18690 [Brachybacterium kimchii]